MESFLNQILEFAAHPVILILASVFIFFLLAWLALPFALYGIRRRLDRIVQLLEQSAQVSAGRGDASAVSPDSTDYENVASALFADLRKDLLLIARPLRERVFDQKNVVFYYERVERIMWSWFFSPCAMNGFSFRFGLRSCAFR